MGSSIQRNRSNQVIRDGFLADFVGYIASDLDYSLVIPRILEHIAVEFDLKAIIVMRAGHELQSIGFKPDIYNRSEVEITPEICFRLCESTREIIEPTVLSFSDSIFSNIGKTKIGHLISMDLMIFPIDIEDSEFSSIWFIGDSNNSLFSFSSLQIVVTLLYGYFRFINVRSLQRQSNKKLQLLESFSSIASKPFNLREILTVFMNILSNVISAEVGTFILWNEDSSKREVEINWGISFDDLNDITSKSGNIIDFVLRKDKMVNISELKKDGFVYKSSKKKAIKSIIAAPVRMKSDFRGILVFANKHSFDENIAVPFFSLDDVEIFSTMLKLVEKAVDNYFIYNELVKVKNFNEDILNSIKSGIISVDINGRITSSNRISKKIINYEANLEGLMLEQVFPIVFFKQENINKLISSGLLVEKNGEFRYEINERVKIFEFIFSILEDGHENRIGAVISFRDLTEYQELQKQVQRHEQLAALGELAAGIAHEIRNPLTSMQGFVQLLPHRLNDAGFMDKFQRVISEQVDRMNEITGRLLNFSSPDSKIVENVYIPNLVEDALFLSKFQMKKKNIVCHKELNKNIRVVKGNGGELTRVFLNLIINAVNAMDKNGKLLIRIFLKNRPILVEGKKRKMLAIEFCDDGHGISDADKKKIFNPFYTTSSSGTGLGLSISYRTVEQHDGLIQVDSSLEKGTIMRVLLPITEGDDG